jgi:CelD/BcsL family acetyltransferase involved in cellulose biosynthesis
MITTEVVWTPGDLFRYRDDWKRLFVEGGHEPSSSFEWTQALVQNHIKDNDHFFLILLKDNNIIQGILPLIASQEKVFHIPLTTISPISERYNTHIDFLIADTNERFIQPMIEALFSLPCTWDLFRMTRLLEKNPVVNALEKILINRRARFRTRFEAPSFFLALPTSFDQYMASRTNKFRNHLRRAEKKLSRLGNIAMIKTGKDLDLDSSFSALINIEEKSWKHKHGTAISAIQHQLSFYQKMCQNMWEAGRLHLTFLTLDNIPVAYNLGLTGGKTYYYLKTSFEESLRPQSPSTILRARLINSLIEEGISTFDFPGEPYEWETQWTEDLRWHRSFLIYNRTMKAELFALLTKFRNLNRRHNDEKKLVYHDPFVLKSP